MVTAREVAKLAGVSQATVSRVLHEHTSVSEDVRRKVRRVMAETGYQPNGAARAMRTNRTGTVGLIVDDMTNPFYPELIRVLGAELGAAGLRMILWDSAGPGERAALDAIDQRLVDGLLFTTATAASVPLARAIDRGAPVVLVNRTVPDLACDQVDSDNHAGAAAAARYFAAAGRREVALVDGPLDASTARDRGAGFRDGCAGNGLDLPPWRIADGGLSHDGGRAAMARILAGGPAPSAVFCANDFSAFGALDALAEAGLSVPRDVWVIGYDDIPMAAWGAFGLTTVRQPLADMAATAVSLLRERVAEPGRAVRHQRFRNDLVPRRTTDGQEAVR
ncbi:LacI family DNA-binding transcriptional regulator [Amycolatopsis sp. CA-230715]|uniref:LacI family DNA-binding transcriptional regulator n=1 Tax=Amycolatopsis sp. CA-230715 TaxID=2745196 RepID=UPI001C035C1E|nr:LacI family DNA-binding transcriptional regulator [Amycolatopsis sp. CA-230715]QWF84230.1 Ribose operon repressor [Amycolatopsis sp. CA-230715]